ncbi:MAG: hypothetical protein KME21_17050 [Desmonostoc vinosum HA7617-LM4]|nr:hypothetical protein [Desmonostoc vinosum HA7617-LM4]
MTASVLLYNTSDRTCFISYHRLVAAKSQASQKFLKKLEEQFFRLTKYEPRKPPGDFALNPHYKT